MTTFDIIHLILGSGGGIGILIIIFKMGKATQRFNNLENQVKDLAVKMDQGFTGLNSKIDKVKDEVNAINIRLSILEAETVIFNMIPEPNRRSEAATRRHAKKREERQLIAAQER